MRISPTQIEDMSRDGLFTILRASVSDETRKVLNDSAEIAFFKNDDDSWRELRVTNDGKRIATLSMRKEFSVSPGNNFNQWSSTVIDHTESSCITMSSEDVSNWMQLTLSILVSILATVAYSATSDEFKENHSDVVLATAAAVLLNTLLSLEQCTNCFRDLAYNTFQKPRNAIAQGVRTLTALAAGMPSYIALECIKSGLASDSLPVMLASVVGAAGLVPSVVGAVNTVADIAGTCIGESGEMTVFSRPRATVRVSIPMAEPVGVADLEAGAGGFVDATSDAPLLALSGAGSLRQGSRGS